MSFLTPGNTQDDLTHLGHVDHSRLSPIQASLFHNSAFSQFGIIGGGDDAVQRIYNVVEKRLLISDAKVANGAARKGY